MGILSASASVVRYRVKGELKKPILDTIASGLNKHRIGDIDNHPEDKACGWASYQNPYVADFSGSSFIYDPYVIFCMRLDKKTIPPKTVQKRYVAEMARRLAQNGRSYISRHEKKEIKEGIVSSLWLRIPATPNIYDVLWWPEKEILWFFSTLKSANEALESLFIKSFSLPLIRILPYTQAHYMEGVSAAGLDRLGSLTPTHFATAKIN